MQEAISPRAAGLRQARDGIERQITRMLQELDNRGEVIKKLREARKEERKRAEQYAAVTECLKQRVAALSEETQRQRREIAELQSRLALASPQPRGQSCSPSDDTCLSPPSPTVPGAAAIVAAQGQQQGVRDATQQQGGKDGTREHVGRSFARTALGYLGMATLFTIQAVVTCAHYVNTAIGLTEEEKKEKQERERLFLPEDIGHIPDSKDDNRWRVVRVLGLGTFARVYECVDEQSPQKQRVAVKTTKADQACIADADSEARLLRLMGQADPQDRIPFVRMVADFTAVRGDTAHRCLALKLHGPALADFLQIRKMTAAESARAVWDVACALDYMHTVTKGLHADIKGDNVLFNDSQLTVRHYRNWGDRTKTLELPPYPQHLVRLADFGGGGLGAEYTDRTQAIVSGPYRPPEVWAGQPWDERVDVWSLGILYAECVTGRAAFCHVENFAEIQAIMLEWAQLPAEYGQTLTEAASKVPSPRRATLVRAQKRMWEFIPEAVVPLVDFMLQPDPQKRPLAQEVMEHPVVLNHWDGAAAANAAVVKFHESLGSASSRDSPVRSFLPPAAPRSPRAEPSPAAAESPAGERAPPTEGAPPAGDPAEGPAPEGAGDAAPAAHPPEAPASAPPASA
eukprot:TRINITY_DN4315_c0_g1_i2.p1 TRINITY_DN4315_c0_g1~~TRINITY_DN4315_c0_g1_i2.p1  ORF type:complete len:669 (+),score=212.84 TRINITY_DN4315_c0_g1_i2:121-2007(+)